jgi:hypothetical protein
MIGLGCIIVSIGVSLLLTWILANRHKFSKLYGSHDNTIFRGNCCDYNDRPKQIYGSKNPSLKLKDKLKSEKYK